MTKTMRRIWQYIVVAIFSLALVLGVTTVVDNNRTASAATVTEVKTVSSLDLSVESTANVYINNGWIKGSYDATESAPKADLSQGHAMLYLSPASWAFTGGMDNLEIGAATRLEITYKNNGAVNNPLYISVSGGNSATDAAWDTQFISKDCLTNTDTSGNWATITVDVSSTSYTHISCVKLDAINAGTGGEMWIRSIALVYDEDVWVPETKIDLSDESVANTYLNNAWVKGSYDATEEAIVADLAQQAAMFYRGPGGMENLYVGDANTLEITYQIRGELTNQPIIVSVFGGDSTTDTAWDTKSGGDFWKDVQRSMTSGQWATLSIDISSFAYDYISVVKLQAGSGDTAGEMYIKSIELKYVAPTTTVTDIITSTIGGENFIMFQLSNNDYAGLNTSAVADVSSLFGYIDIGGSVLNATPNEPYFNLWGNANTFAFRAPGHTATTLGAVEYVTIKAGAKFPAATVAGGYYETTEDVTFVQKSADDWQVRALTCTVTFQNEDGSTYETQTVDPETTATAPDSNPTKASTLDYTYTFAGWYNGGTLYDFSTPVTSDLTLTAKFTESEIAFTEIDTTVTAIHFGHNATFLSFTLSALDSNETKELDASILNKTNLLRYIEINGLAFSSFESSTELNPHFNVYGAKDFSLRMRSVDSVDEFERIVIRKGAQFPSLAYVNGTEKTCYTVSEDVEFVRYYDGTFVNVDMLEESKVSVEGIEYLPSVDATSTHNFLVFTLANSDYPAVTANTTTIYGVDYAELESIKFFDNITLNGTIYLGSETVERATLTEILEKNGKGSIEPIINILDAEYTFALRIPHGGTCSVITSVEIAANTQFPSYNKFVLGVTDMEYRLLNVVATTFQLNEGGTAFENSLDVATLDLWMEKGASIRISGTDDATSGIRFTTNVSVKEVNSLQANVDSGVYKSVEYGTIIVPYDYIIGGELTHNWLDTNNTKYIDIVSSGWKLKAAEPGVASEDREIDVKMDEDGKEYYYYQASIVKLYEKNYTRKFSGLGYVKITYPDDSVKYYYAPYEKTYARTVEYIAKKAIADRVSDLVEDKYENFIEADNNYSPYTAEQLTFLARYVKESAMENVLSAETLTSINTGIQSLAPGATTTVTLTDEEKALPGAYIRFEYEIPVDLVATLNYSNASGSITVNEEVYLFSQDSEYKQYLDLFRTNGAGYGIPTDGVYLHSITFKNVGTSSATSATTISGFQAENRTIDEGALQQYLTRYYDDGSNITIGVHLGLGGSLTYLAKSGLAEYSKDESSLLGRKYGRIEIGTDSANGDTVYRAGTSSLPKSLGGDGVNLINNYDVGRQVQQAYYADVSETEYTKAQYGPTGYEQDWPYNPVQAGDQYNNASQIIDFEINTSGEEHYIYVKARPMDWAQNNVTTKSYVENYYKLKADGTIRVDNNFIDWNGFSDMGDFQSNELPAVYLSQALNYYVSNLSTEKEDKWTGDLTFNNQVGTWSDSSLSDYAPVHQGNGANTTLPYGNHENWFAWATGGTVDSIGVGVYIPNTAMFTSGRSATTTAFGESGVSTTKMIYKLNRGANDSSHDYYNQLMAKDLLSNMDTIDYEYMSCYVQNTSYTAPSIAFKMQEYVPLSYSYVIAVDTISNMRSTFQALEESGSLNNNGFDAWDRNDK